MDTITVTEKEIKNSENVMVLLSQIDGISYEQSQERPDIFYIHEEDSELTAIVDVEEDIVVSFIEIAQYQGSLPQGLSDKLIEINHGAVHGAFTTSDGRLYFKSNLEIENLDLNELEASLQSVFHTVYNKLETINKYFQ